MVGIELDSHRVTCPCWAPSLIFLVVETGGTIVVVLVAPIEFAAVAAWVVLPFDGAEAFDPGWAGFYFLVAPASAPAPPAASGLVGGGLAQC